MFSKNIWTNSLCTVFLLSFLIPVISSAQEKGGGNSGFAIQVRYPKDSQFVSAVDSTFILGSVPAVQELRNAGLKLDSLLINGYPVPVHESGGFLAFLPVEPGPFDFSLSAYISQAQYRKGESTEVGASARDFILRKTVTVTVPKPLEAISSDSLAIAGEFDPPGGDLILTDGDILQASFVGTPGCRAWFAIPGLVDSVSMAELPPRQQPYWGESVFGAGAVPDSLMIRGTYSGYYKMPAYVQLDTVRVLYFLAAPDYFDIIWKLLSPNTNEKKELAQELRIPDTLPVQLESTFRLSLNRPDFPVAVRFTDSVQTVRHGPRRGYLSIFQPEGVEALAVGAEGEWLKLKLSSTQYGWVNKNSVEMLPAGVLPPHSYLSVVREKSYEDYLLIEFPLSGKHPFRITEPDRRTLRIQVFGVTSDTDWIRYDFSDQLVDLAVWEQPEPGMYELVLHLSRDIWGYDGYYSGNTFYCRINRPPDKLTKLKGKVIVVDPGHSGDPGSIGPTGLTEAEANLAVALKLRDELEKKGATVVMTREDDSPVALYDRPSIAKAVAADLFISIHNNALPDGVNPFLNNGHSAYYYHPHSMDLARAIHSEMGKKLDLPDHGLYYGNLAVNRPTQYPAVLIECAFMIIPEQEALLRTEKFQEKVAKAIRKGVERFLRDYDRD